MGDIGMDMELDLKHGIFLLGGIALGALGTIALSRGKLDLKPLCADVLSRCIDAREAARERAESVRETADDNAAEAHAIPAEGKAAEV
jgi:hypothetical protein